MPCTAATGRRSGGALSAADGIPWWVIRTHQSRRRDFAERFRRSEQGQAAVIQLGTPAAAEAFLAQASAAPGSPAQTASKPCPSPGSP